MRAYLIFAATILMLSCASARAQPPCEATVEARVEVGGEDFTLASLLSPDACPGLRQAAAGIRLGAAPLAGSARVLEGDQVRGQFAELKKRIGGAELGWPSLIVPERIVIERAGKRASCAEIAQNLLATLHPETAGLSKFFQPQLFDSSGEAIDCGVGHRIPTNAPVEATRSSWNSASGRLEISARCVHLSDCVPFLIRIPGGQEISSKLHLAGSTATADALDKAIPAVHRGDKVTLIWDGDGIRVAAAGVSLENGAPGQNVRVRLAQSGRIIRAVVVSAGMLRAAA